MHVSTHNLMRVSLSQPKGFSKALPPKSIILGLEYQRNWGISMGLQSTAEFKSYMCTTFSPWLVVLFKSSMCIHSSDPQHWTEYCGAGTLGSQ